MSTTHDLAWRAFALGFALAWLPGTQALAQPAPADPNITAAALRINSFTPQAVPQQTIRIGTYDAATEDFTWLIEEGYPSHVPAVKWAENGGPYQPDHFAEINSFNVTYEFEIKNRPAGFRLTLRTPDANGNMVEKAATLSGSFARVSFNPYSFAEQVVTIQGVPLLRITPLLQPQLGSFVVPQLLLAIVYEPPGAIGFGSFGQRNTASTSISWGFERSSGLVQHVALDRFTQAVEALQGLANGVQGAASVLSLMFGVVYSSEVAEYAGKAGEVLGVIHTVMGQTEEVTTTQGQTGGGTTGTSISVEVGVKTNEANGIQYPGADDRFVHLHDVLYVYMVLGRKVILAPVSYGSLHAPNAAGLQQELPQLASEWIALDPLLTGNLVASATAVPKSVLTVGGRRPSRFEQPAWLPSLQCEQYGPNYVEMTEEQFRSVRAGQTTTRTTLTHAHGINALLGQTDQPLQSVRYSSSQEQTTAQATVARVEMQCAPGAEHAVDLYVDKVFRTLLAVRGQPLGGQFMIAGTAAGPAGRPLAGQRVTLTIGGRSYAAVTDAQGNFRFRRSDIPRGSGVLTAGTATARIDYVGAPITGLRLGAPAEPKTEPRRAPASRSPRAPGVSPRNP
jgi:hypothetical protein